MGITGLSCLLAPERIAVFSNSKINQRFEARLFQNIISHGFSGPIYPIDGEREAVCGIPAHRSLKAIKKRPDLALIAGPPETVPNILERCGRAGIPAAVVFSMDFRHRARDSQGLISAIQRICFKYHIRCVGPNSLGIIRPGKNLNLSISLKAPPRGRIAFLSQSSTLAASILDYAASKNVGLSTFVSLGGQVDVDFSDIIDFLALDTETRGIIVYLESIKNGRRFMSACRSFTRTKPIVAIKGGRFEQSRLVSFSRMGALAGEDTVYDAVFKRAGMVRVEDVLELFNTSEALSKQPTPRGNHLAIATNAGGPAILAIDVLIRKGGHLAGLEPQTIQEIKAAVPASVPISNPVDCLSDASAQRFSRVIKALLQDDTADGVLVILTPQPLTEPMETARELAALSKKHPYKTILACWMGSGQMDEARRLLNENNIPTFVAPEQAVKSFLYMYEYEANRQLLSHTPSNILVDFHPDKEKALAIFRSAAEEGRLFLLERETKQVLEAYGIETTPMALARTPKEALKMAKRIGFPVALKIESPDIPNKSKAGGVRLHVLEDQVESAFQELKEGLKNYRPGATFHGCTVEPMILGMDFEFAISGHKDPTFGAVMVFGLGGQLLEAEKDYAVGLPPLNQAVARRLMKETRICRYLFEDPDNLQMMENLEKTLVRFSILVADFPFIKEIEVNSFFLDKERAVSLDGRIVMEEEVLQGIKDTDENTCPDHLVICPYPCKYIERVTLKDGTSCIIRPIKPEDEPLMAELFSTFSEQTIINRFFQLKKSLTHDELARYCQVDYDREIALVAVIETKGQERIVGVCRLTIMPDGENAELAVVVGDPWQGLGIGKVLMEKTLKVARERGLKRVWMEVLKENKPMNRLAEKFGFKSGPSEDPDIVRYILEVPEWQNSSR